METQPVPDQDPPDTDMRDDEKAALRDHIYKVALGLAVILIAGATVFYRLVEGWTWVDSFYFSCIAVSTVGFGDLSPTTDASKLFTVFYIFAGISIVTVVLNERLRRHTLRRTGKHSGD